MHPETDPILLALKAKVHNIDTKIDSMATRLDRLMARLDKYNTRLDGAKRCISDLEDGATILAGKMSQIERHFAVTMAKNEDLEARSERNKICLADMAESTNMGRPEIFVKA
ncbi:hypothetical protein NDU88_004859 [Pleurodeles waltl]|uniref:Uncharacterized protein n=1 Tax=Pleurodeles waltl TaxID=8319 RepID=A0AAV7SK52_PLEWA|nr:hypothetical protein NDU88_004859 [Pleurodeles waltl]